MNNNHIQFYVNKVIGIGGSCIAYRVSYKENDEIVHYGILKEYCPAFLEESGQTVRDENGALIIPDEYINQFNEGLEYFKNTYKTINNYLLNNLSASNYHTVQMGLYEGNNTAYTLTSCDYGKSYEQIEDKSLHMLLKITLSVTKAVEMYHNAGFLHLDIKPKNILILDDVEDLIKLFDFDSLTSIKKIKQRNIDRIPIPEDYYVPELNNRNLRNIGISTDIFEIGAMMYERIFGFAPNEECISSDAKYDFDSAKLLDGLAPQVKYELTELFRHTIRVSPRERYQSTEDLKNQLSKLISLTSENVHFLMNMPKWQPSKFFVGRQDELKELKNRLDSDGYVFVKAMGGTGKSELAKMFANKYANEYHTVQFCKYTDSLKSVVASVEINGISNEAYSSVNELVKEKNKILHNSDCHTLLVIDNFNVTHDEFLREFLPSDNNGFKVIFTTRCTPVADYYENKVMPIEHLPEELAITLFYDYCGYYKNYVNTEIIKNILKLVDYNTLVIVLVSKLLNSTNRKLSEIERILMQSQLENVDGTVFHEYDFSSIDGENYNKVFAHLNTIFNISNLSETQKEIMKDMSLIADVGINIKEFLISCNCDRITDKEINDLCLLGWINKEKSQIISIHPIISDLVAANKSVKKKKSYYNLADNLVEIYGSFFDEHIDFINASFAYLYHLDKRFNDEVSFTIIDIKLSLARTYYNLFEAKNAINKYEEAKNIIKTSFRFKPRYCFYYFGLANIEENFGSPDKAIELYKKAIDSFKKTINMFYELCFESLCGIASCYEKKHDYKNSYKYYLKAYDYTQNRGIKDGFKQLIFPSIKKDLTGAIPSLCDSIIEICTELENYDEIQKFKEIKKNTESFLRQQLYPEMTDALDDINNATIHLDKAKELFYKSNIKDGLREFFKYLDFIKETYGEESPIYIETWGEVTPLIINANLSDGNVPISSLDSSFEFIKSKYGENSMRFAEYLILISEVLSDTKEVPFSEQCAEKAKQICINLNQKNTFIYQEANLVLVSALIIQGKIGKLRNVVGEIDFGMFKSKSDFEKLVKYAGMALVELSEYDKAIEICKKLIEKKNVTPIIFCMACYAITEAYIEKGNVDEALVYLEKEKPVLDSLDESWQKAEYIALYYCSFSWLQALKYNYEKAISIIDECLKSIHIDNEYVKCIIMCRIYILKTQIYRMKRDFKNALDCICTIEKYLERDDISLKYMLELMCSLAVCYVANGEIDNGIDYFTQFEKLYEKKIGSVNEKMLISIVDFIDALLVGGSYKVVSYIEKAEVLVEKLNYHEFIYNARLENSIGVYLSDYEGRPLLAKERFQNAKYILEKINAADTPLYRQVIDNIDYLRDIIVKDIIKDMADSMLDNNTSAKVDNNE